MKYLKKFENININCKDGDYVLFKYTDDEKYAYQFKLTDELTDFINSNVGIVVAVSNPKFQWVSVRYENIPETIKHKFHSGDNSILLDKSNLVATSDTDEDLKMKYDANKYNL